MDPHRRIQQPFVTAYVAVPLSLGAWGDGEEGADVTATASPASSATQR